MFDKERGFVHFYISADGLRYPGCTAGVDLLRSLVFLLKQQGFFGIWTAADPSLGIRLDMRDEMSAEMGSFWLANRKKSLFAGWGGPSPEMCESKDASGNNLRQIDFHSSIDQLEEFWETMALSGERPCAFVLTIPFFDKITREKKARERLLSILRKEENRSVLVLVGSGDSRMVMHHLMDLKEVFAEGFFPPFEDISRAASEPEGFYRAAVRLSDGCFEIFDPFSRDQILQMLRKGVIRGSVSLRAEHLEDFSDFLYYWKHAPAFRKAFPAGLKGDSLKTLSSLEAALETPVHLLSLTRAVAAAKEGYYVCDARAEEKWFLPDDPSLPLDEENPLVVRMDSADLERLLEKIPDEAREDTRRIYWDMRYEAAVIRDEDTLKKKELGECIDQMDKILAGEVNAKAASAWTGLLSLAGAGLDEYSIKKKQIYSMIITQALAMDALSDSIARMKEKIASSEQELSSIISLIAREESDPDNLSGGKDMMLSAKKKQALGIKQTLDAQVRMCAEWEDQIAAVHKSIAAMELMLDQKQAQITAPDLKILDKAAQLISEISTLRL